MNSNPAVARPPIKVSYRTVEIDDLDIFFREAGPPDAPVLLLLHGFPTSSHMFRNLIPALADEFHLVAPDYPGFGNSSMPTVEQFEYTFDHLADVIDKFTEKVGLKKYSLYVQDYGAPVGYRLSVKHAELEHRPTVARPAGERRDPAGHVFQLRQQPWTLPGMAGLFSPAPAADANRLGEERSNLPSRRCRAV